MQQKPLDPIIEEVRAARHLISERCGHDPVQLVEYYMKLQERYRDRLVNREPPWERDDQSAA